MGRAASVKQPGTAESLWAQIKDQTNRGHLTLGVCSRALTCGPCWFSPFSSCSQALILVGVSILQAVCWESSIAGCEQSGRSLESVEDFLVQVLPEKKSYWTWYSHTQINSSEVSGAAWAVETVPWGSLWS